MKVALNPHHKHNLHNLVELLPAARLRNKARPPSINTKSKWTVSVMLLLEEEGFIDKT